MLLAGALSLLAPRLAHAQGSDKEIADLMAAVQTDYEAGRFPDAEAKGEKAWAQRKTVDIAVTLAEVELKLGKFDEAAQHLHYAKKTVNVSESEAIRRRIEDLYERARAESGAVVLIPSVPGCEARVAGKPDTIAISDDPIFVTPGTVEVTVSKQGHEPATVKISVAKAERKQVPVELKPIKGDVVIPPPPDEKPLWPTILLAGIGAAALGTGIGLTVAGSSAYGNAEDLASACPTPTDACIGGVQEELDQADLFQNVGFVMYGLAAAATTGMVIYLVLPAESPSDTAVLPLVDPSFAGVGVTHRF